jgi:muramidase (phage lysozyme)/anti-sigma28 factor (negative regulator of flagellin synthesis)
MADLINTVGPSRREISPPNPSINPAAFGDGISQALRGLSGAFENSAEALENTTLAYDAKNRATEDASARVRFIKMQHEFSREMIEASRDAPLGAPEFTNTRHSRAKKLGEEFLASLPADPYFRRTFAPMVETFVQDSTDSAFDFEMDAKDKRYQVEASELVFTYAEDVLNSETPAEGLDAIRDQFQAELNAYLSASPLEAEQSEALRKSLELQFNEALFARKARDEAFTRVSQINKDPVAAGASISSTGRAILHVISGRESGHKYNILYSPDGQRIFTDFSAHPNQPATIASGPNKGKVSTAAGRYQFIKGTWEAVAAKYGLTDFSPANQDRGAWHLATDTYANATGRDLETDILSGDRALIEQARQVLGTQWEGIHQMSPEAFYKQVAGAVGNPPDFMYDEEFANIPILQREQIFADAQASATNVIQQQQTEYTAQTNILVEQLRQSIANGEAGTYDINKLATERGINLETQQSLTKLFEETNATSLAATAAINSIMNPNLPLDPNSEETTKNFDALMQVEKVGERLAQGDSTAFDGIILPSAKRGVLTDYTASLLMTMAGSTDLQMRRRGYEALSRLSVEAEQAFNRAIPEATRKDVVTFRAMEGVVSDEQLATMMSFTNDPATLALRNSRSEAFQRAITQGEIPISNQAISDTLFDGAVVDEIAGTHMASEYTNLLRHFYTTTGDLDRAKEMAMQIMGKNWGVMEFDGEERVLRHPPQTYFPAFFGSHDYIPQQVKEIAPDRTGISIISDNTTEKQVRAGKAPSYRVVAPNQFGIDAPLTVRDTPGFRDLPPLMQEAVGHKLLRYTPHISNEMREKKIAEQIAANTEPPDSVAPNPFQRAAQQFYPPEQMAQDTVTGGLTPPDPLTPLPPSPGAESAITRPDPVSSMPDRPAQEGISRFSDGEKEILTVLMRLTGPNSKEAKMLQEVLDKPNMTAYERNQIVRQIRPILKSLPESEAKQLLIEYLKQGGLFGR